MRALPSQISDLIKDTQRAPSSLPLCGGPVRSPPSMNHEAGPSRQAASTLVLEFQLPEPEKYISVVSKAPFMDGCVTASE